MFTTGQVVIRTFEAVHDRSQEACAVCGKLAFEKTCLTLFDPVLLRRA